MKPIIPLDNIIGLEIKILLGIVILFEWISGFGYLSGPIVLLVASKFSI